MTQHKVSVHQLDWLDGKPVYTSDAEKVGNIVAVHYDKVSGEPRWISLCEVRRMFVPLEGAQLQDGSSPSLRVPYSKDKVRSTPYIAGGQLSDDTFRLLYEHYGLESTKGPHDAILAESQVPAEANETKSSRGKGQIWRRTTDHLLGFPPAALAISTIRKFQEHDGPHMAAGIAYYAVVALFPLMLGLITLASFFLDQGVVRQRLFEFAEAILPASIGLLEQTINKIIQLRGAFGVVTIVAVFWVATGVFGAISRAVNRAWGVREGRPFLIAKARHLIMGLGVGLLVVLSAVVTLGSEIATSLNLTGLELPAFMEILSSKAFATLVALSLTFVMFALVYKVFHNANVRWSEVWPGALLAAVFFEAGKSAFIYYVSSIAIYERVYGSLASVIILLVWLYYSALILIIGAEFAAEYARRCRGKPEDR